MKLELLKEGVYIKQLSCEENLPNLTILTGVNGSGKTQLLKMINGKTKNTPNNKSKTFEKHIKLTDDSEQILDTIYFDYNTFMVGSKETISEFTINSYKLNEGESHIKDQYQLIQQEILNQLFPKEIRDRCTSLADFNAQIHLAPMIVDELQGDYFSEYDAISKEINNNFDRKNPIGPDYIIRIIDDLESYIEYINSNEYEALRKVKNYIEIQQKELSNLAKKYHLQIDKINVNKPILPKTKPFNESSLGNDFLNLCYQYLLDEQLYYISEYEKLDTIEDAKKYNIDSKLYRKKSTPPWIVLKNALEKYNSLFPEYKQLTIDESIFSKIGLKRNSKAFERTNFIKNNLGEDINPEYLSSGEKTIFALCMMIYTQQTNNRFPKVLLLDEIDSALHPSAVKQLLSVITDIFINEYDLKVIMTTHSPTTIVTAPDDSVFKLSYDNQNGVHKVAKIAKDDALHILSEGFVAYSYDGAQQSILCNIKNKDSPVLCTEGITDKIIIETAWDKLYPETSCPFYIQDCFCAIFLNTLFNREDSLLQYDDKTFIALFDFDNEGYNQWNGGKKYKEVVENNPMKCLTKKIPEHNFYRMLLPVPDNERIQLQVIKNGKDTYKSESVLYIEHLFYGINDELDGYFTEEKVPGGGVQINIKSGKKKEFANLTKDANSDCFKAFIPLFEKIKNIIENAPNDKSSH